MKIFYVILVLVSLVFVTFLNASPHKNYFDNYLNQVSLMLETSGFKGPLSEDLAKISLGRQVLEDSVTRRPDYSVAGISIGGFNSDIVKDTVKETHLKISHVYDSEGGRFFSLHGAHANVYSAISIAKLFDFYPYQLLKKHKVKWMLSKQISYAIHCNKDSYELRNLYHNVLKPETIIQESNKIYGPKSESVMQIVNSSTKE